jgi:hypothetical protein
MVDPDGGSGWDEPQLDFQIPDDARELDRDVLAYRRELRAQRRRRLVRRLAGPLARNGTIMPLLASILAVCLVAGAMLSVATFSPAPGVRPGSTARPIAPSSTTSASHSAAAPRTSRAPSPATSASHRPSPHASGSPTPGTTLTSKGPPTP